MAGDIGIEEKVIVVSSQAGAVAGAVAASARQQGARVFHRYGPRVLIGEVSEDRTQQVRSALATADVAAAPSELPSGTTEGLDPIGALGLAAFSLRQSA